MPSTYTVNLGIEKPATGEQSGTWGDTTNVNFDIIDQAVNGSERVTLTSAGTSGSPNDLNIVNGSTTSSEGRNKWIEIYSASDLGGSAYVRLVPNDAEKILFIRNSLAGSQSVLLFQGTYNASNDLEIPAGVDMVVKFDGAGASATVTDVFTKLRATEITTPTLTAGTADINGGSVDGATVGAASASTGAFTTLTASTSLNIASSTTVDGVLDEDNMASDSATKLATQQSIKAYVDSQVGTVDTLAEILANGNTSGANNLIIDSGQALTANTINETTAGTGVTIDSVLLKDDVVNATDIETSNISANDGTAAATIANSTGNFTITNFISNSVDIGGGAIDGTNIGASSAATGAFTTLSTTSDATLGNDILMTNDSHIQWGSASSRLEGNSSGTDTLKLYTNSTENLSINGSAGGSVVVNEGSSNLDFRVESTNNANMLFVDAGTDRVGVGTNAPAGIGLTVDGGATVGTYFYGGTNNRRQLTFTSFDTASLDAGHEITASSVSGRLLLSASSVNHLQIDAVSNTTVFNENSTDQDFRVESNNNSAMLFVDAGNDAVGINTSSPTANVGLTVQGQGDNISISLLGDNPGATQGNRASIRFNADLTQAFEIGMGDNMAGGGRNFTIQETSTGSSTTATAPAYMFKGNGDGRFYFSDSNDNIVVDLNSEAGQAFVFNENSTDTDFRVESDSNTHMLFVDAGNSHLGIGESAPSELIHATQNGGDAVLLLENTGVSSTDDANIQLKTTLGTFTLQNDRSLDTQGAFTIAGAASYFQIDHADGNMAFNTSFINVNDTDPILRLYASNGGSGNGAPELQFYRDGGLYGSIKVVPNVEFRLTSPNAVGQLNFHANGDTQRLSLGSSAVFNEPGNDYDFRVESDSSTHAFFVDAGNNVVGVGTSQTTDSWTGYTPLAVGNLFMVGSTGASSTFTNMVHGGYYDGADWLQRATDVTVARHQMIGGASGSSHNFYTATNVTADTATTQVLNLSFTPTTAVFNEDSRDIDFRVESNTNANALFIDGGSDLLYIGKNSGALALSGFYFNCNTGATEFTHTGTTDCMRINRLANDGTLISFWQDTSNEGNISVSGSTVSYNGFAGRHESSGILTTTPKGTVVSTIDELDEYLSGPRQGQTRADHAKVEVSSSVGDPCVYGVVDNYTEDGSVNVVSVGIGAVLVTGACAKGDLLESNGDGTAKVQSDDIVRSKTIGKVTIGDSNTGVKLVSCVLYCG